MARRSDKVERVTLQLFKLAYRQNRLDVAEHLLRALETLERHPEIQESTHVAGAPWWRPTAN
ncbi:hypothetical protein EH240_22000 [Mesorhizobium tamadayense]|uniref:Uncharacterized protein n=1 Tax=Mesorhizobium tamadayense TaxID=425306 RepID=A0A3P3FDA6_9HYPH|nr:hypothetical protein [Mesorhizobium tamadayense]RRH96663.1 hypothetical protein EH240_22000 [Mesorhizobium tamadayense]